MAKGQTLKVTAHMASPIAGDVPLLDGLLEFEMVQREGKAERIRRDQPLDPYGDIHIPMLRGTFGGHTVPRCSSPIVRAQKTATEHFAKRLGVEHAELLSEKKRLVVATGNATYKSYRLPLRLTVTDRVVWFCVGHRRPIKSLLRSVHSIGHKRSVGYGRVSRWELEYVDLPDVSWFARSDDGPVLMRPLPWCDELPKMLSGFRRDFGACQSPYWHPDRYMEIVTPC